MLLDSNNTYITESSTFKNVLIAPLYLTNSIEVFCCYFLFLPCISGSVQTTEKSSDGEVGPCGVLQFFIYNDDKTFGWYYCDLDKHYLILMWLIIKHIASNLFNSQRKIFFFTVIAVSVWSKKAVTTPSPTLTP